MLKYPFIAYAFTFRTRDANLQNGNIRSNERSNSPAAARPLSLPPFLCVCVYLFSPASAAKLIVVSSILFGVTRS